MVIDTICPFLEGGSLKICESSWNTYFIMFLTLSALDYRLNPVLRKACKADIPKFCHGILTKAKEDSELEGQVISCLKLRYADQVNWPGLSTEVCSWSRLCSWHWFSWEGLSSLLLPQDLFYTFPTSGAKSKAEVV